MSAQPWWVSATVGAFGLMYLGAWWVMLTDWHDTMLDAIVDKRER